MSHILQVGFEIEGGWKGTPRVSPFTDITLIEDHSINGQTLKGEPIRATHVGEAVSPPIDFNEVQDGKPSWEIWLSSHWPDADPPHRTNSTCGFHIHASLDNFLNYSLLTSKTAVFWLRDQLIAHANTLKLRPKHSFWNRMNGANQFCNFQTDPARQMRLNSKNGSRDRYGFLNYSYGVHGTVEFRALPTFRDAHIAVSFANAYFKFLDQWLDDNQPEQLPLVRQTTFQL